MADIQGPGVRFPGDRLGDTILDSTRPGTLVGVPDDLQAGVRPMPFRVVPRTINAGPWPSGRGITTDTIWRAKKWAGVAEELERGYRSEYQGMRGETLYTRVFRVPFTLQYQFLEDFIGYAVPVPDTDGKSAHLHRLTPDQHPERPWLVAQEYRLLEGRGAALDNPYVLARDANGDFITEPDPDKPGNQRFIHIPMITYVDAAVPGTMGNQPAGPANDGVAVIELTYRAMQRGHKILTDAEVLAVPGSQGESERACEYEYRWLQQAIPLPKDSLVFTDVIPFELAAQNAAYFLEMGGELHITIPEFPNAPIESALALVGKTNAAPFRGAQGRHTFPAESLMMATPIYHEYHNVQGRVVFHMHYTFLVNEKRTWNKLLVADGSVRSIGFSGAGAKLFPTADFGVLFRPTV